MVEDWRTLADGGHAWGSRDAKVVIVSFFDFECGACRRFALGAERTVKGLFGDRISVVVRHLPLSYHRLAFPAAKASECAADQGRFEEIYELLFRKQDSLGIKSLTSFAREGGVRDLQAFESCMSSPHVEDRISFDKEAAKLAGARATPTVIINGLRLAQSPTIEELVSIVRNSLAQPERP